MQTNLEFLNNMFTNKALDKCLISDDYSTSNYFYKNYPPNNINLTNKEVFEFYYKELLKKYRNQYFYKNTLLNKLLLGVHSINTSSVLSELPVANSKADFILINGKAVVYEIKTELDNFTRLHTQLNDYYKAFTEVCVVLNYNESKIDYLKNLVDNHTGIIALQKNNKIKTIRKPTPFCDKLDKKTIFNILRKYEFENILLKTFGKLPKVSQFEYYNACMEKIMEIPIEALYKDFVAELKKRPKINKDEFKKIPYELKFLAYIKEPNKIWYEKLFDFLQEDYKER